MKKSKFGKGLVLCLLYFAQHIGRLEELYKIDSNYKYDKILPEEWSKSIEIWGSYKNILASKIQSWIYAIRDHLSEIEVPDSEEWNKVEKQIKIIEEIVYKKVTDNPLDLSFKDTGKIIDAIDDIGYEIDKLIGLKPIKGEWR